MPAIPRHTRHTRRSRHFVGIFQAKTHLSQLLERVARGEEITITKHDKPVARLVQADRPSRDEVAVVFQRMEALRQRLAKPADGTSLKDMIKEGRRF
jgi:prevent-host-death family protein